MSTSRGTRPLAWWTCIALLLAHTGGVKSWIGRFSTNFSLWDGAINTVMATWCTVCFLKATRPARDIHAT